MYVTKQRKYSTVKVSVQRCQRAIWVILDWTDFLRVEDWYQIIMSNVHKLKLSVLLN